MAVGRVSSSVADNSGIQGHQCGGVGSAWSDSGTCLEDMNYGAVTMALAVTMPTPSVITTPCACYSDVEARCTPNTSPPFQHYSSTCVILLSS
jgi:hypothetical protein